MQTLHPFFIFFSFILGSIIGSFLNVVILRLPREEKLGGRSFCPHCKHGLSSLDLVPFFSYLFLLGKCRYCKKKISPRYFIIEFVTGLLFAFCYWHILPLQLPQYILLFKYFVVSAILLVVFMVDLEHFIILDSVIFTGLAATVVLNLILDLLGSGSVLSFHGNLVGGIMAAIGASLPFFLLWYFSSGTWMGFGDVKLALFLGAALGPGGVLVGLMLAVLSGGAISVFLLMLTNKTLKSRLPFGTFLSLGALLSLFYGEKLLSWYLAFLGF